MNFIGFDEKFKTQPYFCLPRAFDSHVHLEGMGKFSGPHDLSLVKNNDDLKSKLKNLISVYSKSTLETLCYIQAFGLNIKTIEHLQDLILDYLDDEFCLVLADGHSALFFGYHINQILTHHKSELEALPGTLIYFKESKVIGALLGDQGRQYLENLFTQHEGFKQSLQKKHQQETEVNLLRAQDLLLQKGISHCRDMTSDLLQFETLLKLEKQGQFFIYSDLYFSNFFGEKIEDIFLHVKQAQALNTPRIQVKGVKVFLDGSLGSHSLDSSCHHYGPSAFNFSLSDVKNILQLGVEQNTHIAFHCIGDLAFQKIIQAYISFSTSLNIDLHLEHCEFINSETLKSLASLTTKQKQKLYFHFQPSHWLDDHLKIDQKSDLHFFAWDKLFKLGFENIFFGSDAPVTPPLLNLESQPELVPFLQSKDWVRPWWTFFIYPDPKRGVNTFTLYSCAKSEQNLQCHPQVFIDGKPPKPMSL